VQESCSPSQVYEFIYLKELVWSSPISGMEEQKNPKWSRIEESSSPSQAYELIRYLKELVCPPLSQEWRSSRFKDGPG